MQHIPFNQLINQPWKNGQGTTKQVAIFPSYADITNFHWRISIATIKAIGPFSKFDHVTRSLALLIGEKIVLDIDGKITGLYRNGQPITFDGGKNTSMIECTTEGLDFGVMTNNQFATHSLIHHELQHGEYYQRTADITLALALEPCVINGIILEQFDSLLLSKDDALNLLVNDIEDYSISLLIAEITPF